MTETFIWITRVRKPLSKKLNPIWWFQNDDDPDPPTWYHPEWAGWRRMLTWHVIRNPGHNFMFYVVGVQDRNFTVWGKTPVMETDASDSGQYGARWCVILPGREVWIPLPYFSWTGKWFSFHIGWMCPGAFSFRFILTPELGG
jgi:hypothetical protein